MKKFISLMLILLTAALIFTACTSGDKTNTDKQHNTLGDDDGDGVIEDKDDGGKNDMTPDTGKAGRMNNGNDSMTNNGGMNGNSAGNGTTGGNGGMTNNGGAGRGFFGDGAVNDGIDGMGDLAPITP